MVMRQQMKTNRSLGNTQSRLSAIPASPAYENTTNVNGAQTAAGNRSPQTAIRGRSGTESYPNDILAMPKEFNKGDTLVNSGNALQDMMSALPPAAPPSAPTYPGGDAPGIASYYRNSAIQGYQGNQQQQSAMADDVREATRNAQYMEAEPQATSSTGANQIMARQPADLQNAVTARVGNSFNNVVGAVNDPSRYNPTDPSIQARQQDNAQRASSGRPMDRNRDGRASAMSGYIESGGVPWYEREKQARDQMAMEAQQNDPEFQAAMAEQRKQKAVREALRDRSNMNVPQEELARRAAADNQQRVRSNRARAFEAEHGMNYKHADRLAKMQERVERQVATGKITRREADIKLDNQRKRVLSRGRESAISDQARPLSAMPNRPNLATQPPEVAKAAVQTATTQFPVVKELGWTPESKPQDVMNSIAGMNPQQMTSTQKFEAARQIHEYMLSQVESGNPDYAIEDGIASDGSDPRIGFIGLSGIKPGDKDAMVKWFDDLNRQAKSLYRTDGSRLEQMPSYLMGN